MSHGKTEFEMEQQIFLGGQISAKEKENIFKKIAKFSPEYGEMYIFLDSLEEIKKCKTALEKLKLLISLMGQVDFLRTTTELTRLSMILGDTTEKYSMKGE